MENKEILAILVKSLNQIGSSHNFDLKEDINLPLTGSKFYLSAFQLYEFLILIEQRFQIYFTYDEIVKCSLITIKDFADLVHDKLSTYKMQPKL